eukprot:5084620-Prymnesium_polylepis.1
MPVHCAPPYGSIQRVTHTHALRSTAGRGGRGSHDRVLRLRRVFRVLTCRLCVVRLWLVA